MMDLFKSVSDGWTTVSNTVSDGAKSAWDIATAPSRAIINTVSDGWTTVSNTVSDGVSNVTNTVNSITGGVGSVFTNGLSAIRKYWYVPVIVGGVVVGFKILGTAKTASLIKSVAKR